MARSETLATTMPLKAIMFMALIFLTFTFTTSSRILSELETPEEPITDSAESPVSSILPPFVAPTTAPTSATTTSTDIPDQHHTLSFFMHDILGGSNPTARAVTGVVTNPALNAQVAFAKPNGANLPLNNGVPQNNNNNGILNNNNLPFLTGLSGNTGNVFNNNNNGNNFPVTNMNQIPQGTTVQELMFGTMTVFDDELTEGEELGSGLVGKAQGFYIASSTEGTSQVMAFTAKFEENGYEDSLSFFGVHRTTQVSQSQLAIIGGTGKYVNANGFAIIKTFPVNGQQHNTDGLETLLHLTAYLSY
ncbi:putative plant disease resistance response protein [Medicago truncatula]|uniref:Dirigent protein n=1 Tax=Medicago truncatula TaxID=3880 RepID=A0A072UK11_MEDTR|nr:dirigent protein 10 [Medicago truncatula]KEH30094.1 disease resistance-responsive, dirigent domain protein [Medicago truncatula]RHN60884.1 putative plant disease resistance response protein [Medicago truncatula]